MSFEGHRLNDMIDLVEQANPADLESAGEALKKARNAIAAAAKELGEHIDRVDWEGASGEAFRKWGKNLVKDTHQLSDFADTAGVQIASAGAGLASVRSSMPPRDQRADPKMVEDIPTPKRVDGNAEYDAAAKAETHRQEAINQMNRLSSFYQVSQHSMAGQEPPTFSAMPDVGVPQGNDVISRGAEGGAASSTVAAGGAQVPLDRSTDTVMGGDPRPVESSLPRSDGAAPTASPDLIASPDRPVGTEIDSVGTLPPQTVSPAPVSSPPTPIPIGGVGESAPPIGTGPRVPATTGPVARTSVPGAGPKTSLPAQGRTGPTGPARPTAGPGPSNPIGRTAQGRTVSGPTATGQPPVGRAVTGGTPRPAMPGPRPGLPGTGAGRDNGVVGGRPAPGPLQGSSGSRLPRGPVIGTEGRAANGAGGQRGVVGAAPHGTAGGGQPSPRFISSPDGVVGTPKERTSTASGRGNGFTVGGSGLVRGPAGTPQRPDDDEDEGVRRPDYLVEDEETHLPGNRRHVPPVID